MQELLFMAVVFFALTMEGITGFGGPVLAMPFLSHIIGLKLAVPVMAIVAMFNGGYRLLTMHQYIVKKEFLTIAFLVILGLPIGMAMFAYLPEKPLKVFLGIFMVYTAIKGLVECFNPHLRAQAKQEATGFRRKLFLGIVFLGGIMQGAFTCGGPFVVMYATMALKEQKEFRATLFAMWVAVNIIITVKNFAFGALTAQVGHFVLYALPALVLAIILSTILQKYINKELFNKIVYSILLLAGFLMIFG